MFDAIVPTYDVLNRLMSMGMDVGWRRRAVALCLRDRPSLALDVGTGTGDLVRMLAAGMAAGGRAVGVDFSLRMLRTARLTAARPVEAFVAADALELPFERGRMDAMVTAFTLRNVRDLKSALSSFARVLRPGGRLVILEMTPMGGGPFPRLFRFYFGKIVPLFGRLISGHPFAYSYLPDSVRRFPSAEDLARMIADAGFDDVSFTRHGLGSVAIHQAMRGP